jgi:hypothetical protein
MRIGKPRHRDEEHGRWGLTPSPPPKGSDPFGGKGHATQPPVSWPWCCALPSSAGADHGKRQRGASAPDLCELPRGASPWCAWCTGKGREEEGCLAVGRVGRGRRRADRRRLRLLQPPSSGSNREGKRERSASPPCGGAVAGDVPAERRPPWLGLLEPLLGRTESRDGSESELGFQSQGRRPVLIERNAWTAIRSPSDGQG